MNVPLRRRASFGPGAVPQNAAHGSLGLSNSQIAGSVDASQLDGKGGPEASFLRAIEPNLEGSIKIARVSCATAPTRG